MAPYIYHWSDLPYGDARSTSVRTNLNEGNYSVTITDVNGCKDTLKNILVRNNCPTCTLFVTDSIAAKTCSKGGEIYLRFSGGSGNYEISIFNGGQKILDTIIHNSPFARHNVDKGIYNVIVRDTVTQCRDTLNGITVIDSCVIETPCVAALKATAQIENRQCNLTTGGKITMELQDMFWGAYFGSCTDRFGINWMFNCTEKK